MKVSKGIFTGMLALLCLFADQAFAQIPSTGTPDTVLIPDSAPKANTSNDKPGWSRPAKAALYSAVLPGAGQVYNRKYWKVPIVYALGGTIGYFIVDYNKKYNIYRQAYAYRTDGNPETDAFTVHKDITEVRFPESQQGNSNLKNNRDFYRRNRDLNIIFGILSYGLQIADAHVDAHLRDFDVSDDLSLKLTPSVVPGTALSPALGLTLTFDLKNK